MTGHDETRLLNFLARAIVALERIANALDKPSPDVNHAIDDDIQHVSYDEEQCGRNK